MKFFAIFYIFIGIQIFPSKSVEISRKILGGNEVQPHQFNFIVAITPSGGRKGFCGGSIISKDFILSAASCIDGATSAAVRFGAHDLNLVAPIEMSMNIPSSNFKIHPQVNLQNGNYDIAIMKTVWEIVFNSYFGSASLPTLGSNEQYIDSIGLVLGFGYEERLLSYQNLIVGNTLCSMDWDEGYVISSTICMSSSFYTGPCWDDVGGPLLHRDITTGNYELIGIVAMPRCGSGETDLYTRITSVRQWINSETGI